MTVAMISWLAVGCGSTPSTDTDAPDVTDTPEVAPVETRFHRLTRAQLLRSLVGLFGTDAGVGALIPADAATDGFDNTDVGLTVSSGLTESWLAAAEAVALRVTSPSWRDETMSWDVPGTNLTRVVVDGEDALIRAEFQAGDAQLVEIPLNDLVPGTWEIDVRGARSGELVAEGGLTVMLDGEPQKVTQSGDLDDTVWHLTAVVGPGEHLLALGAAAAQWDDTTWTARVHDLRLVGPTSAAGEPVVATYACEPTSAEEADWRACAEQIFDPLLRQAWRGIVPAASRLQVLDQVLAVRTSGLPFRVGVRHAIIRMLMSPYFLFRIEEPQEGERLDGLALASRLGFFLWSAPPDETLLALAEEGRLGDPTVLAQQVQRMIDDPRVLGFEEDFAGQWLAFRGVEDMRLDAVRYPRFDADLRAAMREEAVGLVHDLLSERLPITELIAHRTGHVREPLASLYGVPPGDRVDLTAVGRGGVLGLGAVHAVTSHEARTSIVRRGVWVLSNLLCTSAGSPPANIPQQPDLDSPLDAVNAHTADPVCASCHKVFDPLGVALESFDADGAWRDVYESGVPVDTTTELADGTPIADAHELGRVLASDPRLVRCAADRALTWSVGRRVTKSEVDAILTVGGAPPSSFQDLLTRVAVSESFQTVGGTP